jgi:hypothetical protein
MKINQFKDQKLYINLINDAIKYALNTLHLKSEIILCIELSRLNLIIKNNIEPKLFLKLSSEYTHNRTYIAKKLYSFYIYIIYIMLYLKIPIYKIKRRYYTLPLGYPAIIGGNNRIRLIDSTNSMAIIVSLNIQNDFFIKNIINAYKSEKISSLNVMPYLLPLNDNIYIEKQIDAISINRQNLNENEWININSKLNKIFDKQIKSTINLSLEKYIDSRIKILIKYIRKNDDILFKEYSEILQHVKNKSIENRDRHLVTVSFSHGDLNHGNVFYKDKELFIIDWEYFYPKYNLYDKIIFELNIRHLSISKYKGLILNNKELNFDIVLFLVEDLLFRILNYKNNIENSIDHIDNIINLIYKKLD